MRGAFLPDQHQTPFVPSARPGGRIEGPAPTFLPCHPERSEGSGLTPSSETAQRALARVPDPPDAWTKFFAYGELLLATAPKVTQRAAPESAPSHRKRRSAMRGYPALLGRGGRFRQAIPGLSETASASLPRPRLRAAVPPRPARLGAARRGRTINSPSKAKATSKAGPWRASADVSGSPAPIKPHTYRSSGTACTPSPNLGAHGTHGENRQCAKACVPIA